MGGILELKFGLHVLGKAGKHAVKDVIVSLLRHLINDTGFLQKILFNLSSLDGSVSIKVDVNVLSKSGRVVIANGLGISES